jgi:hypothetical protein
MRPGAIHNFIFSHGKAGVASGGIGKNMMPQKVPRWGAAGLRPYEEPNTGGRNIWAEESNEQFLRG